MTTPNVEEFTECSLLQLFQEISELFGPEFPERRDVPIHELKMLATHSKGDKLALRRYIKRSIAGDPIEYIIGYTEFMGRRFSVDRRVHITELGVEMLVKATIDRVEELYESLGRPIQILEFGVGCGALAITLLLELKAKAHVVGLDIDQNAIAVATSNSERHNTKMTCYESDGFHSIPIDLNPDLIVANPPWGDQNPDYYQYGRPLSHYLAMPAIAEFSIGGVTGVHKDVLVQAKDRNWNCEILFYNDELDEDSLMELLTMVQDGEILRHEKFGTVLHCKRI